MSEKLDKVLNNIFEEKKEKKKAKTNKKKDGALGDVAPIALQVGFPEVQKTDIKQDLKDQESCDMQMEPMDKIATQIQHLFISGDFDQANQLIKQYSISYTKGQPKFSWHHLQLLMDWVRSIYKYTNMKDLSKNYYDYQMKQEIEGAKDLTKAAVKEATIDKFVEDVEKVLKKKLKAH